MKDFHSNLTDPLKLSTVAHNDGFRSGTTLRSHFFNFVNNIKTIDDFSENNVSSIEPRGINSADEKLRSVSVRPGIGHGENTLDNRI